MDISDYFRYASVMEPRQIEPPFQRLPADLWGERSDEIRSREVTPLSVGRWAGPRTSPYETTHDYWELTYVFSGTGTLRAAVPCALAPHIAVLVPPGVWHREDALGSLDTLWVGLGGHSLADLASGCDSDIVSVDCPEIRDLCVRLWITAERLPREAGPELDGLARTIIGAVIRRQRTETTPTTSVVESVVDHVRDNIARPISVGLQRASHWLRETRILPK